MKSMKIFVQGGLIQDIQDIPDGLKIDIYDYDIDGLDEKELTKDGKGKDCYIKEW